MVNKMGNTSKITNYVVFINDLIGYKLQSYSDMNHIEFMIVYGFHQMIRNIWDIKNKQ